MTPNERLYYRELGARIRAAREQRGLSQKQLARTLDLRSGVAIHHWEQGRSAVRVYAVRRLEHVLGTELYR